MPRRAVITLLISLCLTATEGRAQTLPYQYVESDETLNYLLHLPPGYEQSGDAFPLLLFLHGIGQKGSGSEKSIERVAADGPFRTMREAQWDNALPLIVIGPQIGGIQPWWRGSAVRKILAHAEARYRIDQSRIYLSGISMGGRSIWWLAREMPDRFAAIVPVSTWAGNLQHSCVSMTHLGVWAFHGEKDPLISLGSGRRPIETLATCQPSPAIPPRLTVLEGAGHGQWDTVYGSRHGERNTGGDGRQHADIYRWLLSFQLQAQ